MNGLSVSVGDHILETNSDGTMEQLMPFGNPYTILFSDIEGYNTPSKIVVDPSEQSRELSVTYTYKQLNVCYFMKDKTTMDYHRNFDASRINDISGILISNGVHEFILGFDEINKSVPVGGYGTLFSGVTTVSYNDFDTACEDYNGEENTLAILSYLGEGSDHAAGWCSNYRFKHGTYGWLPSIGELNMLFKNGAEVMMLLEKIGSDWSMCAWPFSSTQHDANDMWSMSFSSYSGWPNDTASHESHLNSAPKNYNPGGAGSVGTVPVTGRTQLTWAKLTYMGQTWTIYFNIGDDWSRWAYSEDGEKYNAGIAFASPVYLYGPAGSGYEDTKLMPQGTGASSNEIIAKTTYTLVPWAGSGD